MSLLSSCPYANLCRCFHRFPISWNGRVAVLKVAHTSYTDIDMRVCSRMKPSSMLVNVHYTRALQWSLSRRYGTATARNEQSVPTIRTSVSSTVSRRVNQAGFKQLRGVSRLMTRKRVYRTCVVSFSWTRFDVYQATGASLQTSRLTVGYAYIYVRLIFRTPGECYPACSRLLAGSGLNAAQSSIGPASRSLGRPIYPILRMESCGGSSKRRFTRCDETRQEIFTDEKCQPS